VRRLYLSEAQAGDVVAEPVVNERGMVILPKGAELTVPVIGRLQKMNVTEVAVEGEDPNAPPPKTLEELLEELDERFEGLEGIRVMAEIKEIAREHLVARKEPSDE
jgi:hypothetical protein